MFRGPERKVLMTSNCRRRRWGNRPVRRKGNFYLFLAFLKWQVSRLRVELEQQRNRQITKSLPRCPPKTIGKELRLPREAPEYDDQVKQVTGEKISLKSVKKKSRETTFIFRTNLIINWRTGLFFVDGKWCLDPFQRYENELDVCVCEWLID